MAEYGLENISGFSTTNDQELHTLILDYFERHNQTTGQTLLVGSIRCLGIRVQRSRIRKALVRLDNKNTALKWGIVTTRRKCYIAWPNSLWHLDGNHSLIHLGFVIHGCIDGYSRRVIFLECSSNNLSQTVLNRFIDATQIDGGRWSSKILVDYGLENVLVCDAMVEKLGEGRSNFIAQPSTRNQRIEILWKDVFSCVIRIFYYIFYALEGEQLIDIENPVDMLALRPVFLQRIIQALNEFKELHNNHSLRTEGSWTPNQMWLNDMLNPSNPLVENLVDNLVDNADLFGVDPEGPLPFENSDNNVFNITGDLELIQQTVLDQFDLLISSTQMGIDIFVTVKEYIYELISGA